MNIIKGSESIDINNCNNAFIDEYIKNRIMDIKDDEKREAVYKYFVNYEKLDIYEGLLLNRKNIDKCIEKYDDILNTFKNELNDCLHPEMIDFIMKRNGIPLTIFVVDCGLEFSSIMDYLVDILKGTFTLGLEFLKGEELKRTIYSLCCNLESEYSDIVNRIYNSLLIEYENPTPIQEWQWFSLTRPLPK